MINLNICVTDIPKESITVGKNGKKYINVVVDSLKDVDSNGNTHCVKMQQSQEDRKNKVKPTYIGRGKEIIFNNSNQSIAQTQSQEAVDNNVSDDDLPF